MTRQGRPPTWTAIKDLDPTILTDLKAWADSAKRHSAASIYRRFNLVEKRVSIRSFQRWVAKRRKALLAEAAEARRDAGPERSGAEELILGLLVERAEAGDPKHFSSIASALRALCDVRRLGFEDAAEKRAQEIHEEKMAEVRKRKAQADTQMDKISVRNGIPDEVRDAVKRLYGISLEPVTRAGVYDMIDGVMRGTEPK